MGWAHDGAVTSSIIKTTTATRAGGLGGGELESATACCVDAVPGPAAVVPRTTVVVPELGSTTAVPEPLVEVPEPHAGFLQSDPAASGSGDTKMESDSGDGLRRHWRETPVGIACRVEPIRARASACSLSAHGTWRNSHPSSIH